MPEIVLSDLSKIETIVKYFCELKRLGLETWINQPGRTRITDERELLLAVIIMFYQPERLNGMCEKRIKQGIVKELSIVLKCSKKIISKGISSALSNYRIYSEFKNEVDEIYNNLKEYYHG